MIELKVNTISSFHKDSRPEFNMQFCSFVTSDRIYSIFLFKDSSGESHILSSYSVNENRICSDSYNLQSIRRLNRLPVTLFEYYRLHIDRWILHMDCSTQSITCTARIICYVHRRDALVDCESRCCVFR